VPNSESLIPEIRGYGNTVLMSDIEGRGGHGNITGLNGLLLGVAKKRGFEAICLMGEIPVYLQGLPLSYPKASKSVLEVLSHSLKIEVNLDLNWKLRGEEFAEIEPEDFFSLGGVAIKGNLAQFPESKFYACQEHELVVFQSGSPGAEWYKFLNSVLDVAEHHCRVNELYILGAMVSFSAHTAPRELLAVVNSAEMKEVLGQYDLARDMDYQTSPGERPTLNSFLLWIAKGRNINRLESNLMLSEEENGELIKKIEDFLRERD
jgi:proteasome assembly chaperone (PAC2) family protein